MTAAHFETLATQSRELGGEASFAFMQELENAAQHLQHRNRDLGLHYLRLSESHLHQILARLQQLMRAVEALS
jgi:hypothetical protein